MKIRGCKIIGILLICLNLAGCGNIVLLEPSQRVLPTEAKTVPPVEIITPTTEQTESKLPDEDTILDVSNLSLADLQDSYVLLVSNENGNWLYRIYDTSVFARPGARIECYHVAEITEGFLDGEAVDVISAVKNSINYYDYGIFSNRFYYLHDQGKTEQMDEVRATWDGTSSWILRTEDMACVTTDNEMELEELMYLLYTDRGTGKQHFGGTQS